MSNYVTTKHLVLMYTYNIQYRAIINRTTCQCRKSIRSFLFEFISWLISLIICSDRYFSNAPHCTVLYVTVLQCATV